MRFLSLIFTEQDLPNSIDVILVTIRIAFQVSFLCIHFGAILVLSQNKCMKRRGLSLDLASNIFIVATGNYKITKYSYLKTLKFAIYNRNRKQKM